MGIVNVVVELTIQYSSENISRPPSHTQTTIHSISGISLIQFINLGLLLLMISLNRDLVIIKNPHFFLRGQYYDLTTQWYMEYGAIIVQTMVIEIVMPHIIPLLTLLFYSVWRCVDRGCTMNKRKSRFVIQSDYEDLYIGTDFMLDFRLA